MRFYALYYDKVGYCVKTKRFYWLRTAWWYSEWMLRRRKYCSYKIQDIRKGYELVVFRSHLD